MHKAIRSVLRFIIRHKKLNAFFSKYDWFRRLIYEEAQAVIGNRPWNWPLIRCILQTIGDIMDRDEIEILFEVLDLYRTICNVTGAENKIDKTMIEDTLARLKCGEYEIRRNPEY